MSLLLFGVMLPWVIISLFVALGCWISFQLIHQNGRLLSRLEALEESLGHAANPWVPGMVPSPSSGPQPAPTPQPAPAPALPPGLPLGSPAPAFELPDLSGGRRSLAEFRGQKLLLVFFNPGCGFCTQMLPGLAALRADGADGHPIPLVIAAGDPAENRRLARAHSLRCLVLLQEAGPHEVGGEIAARYQCNGTPMGCLVDEQGQIASELAVGADAVLALARTQPTGTDGRNGHGPAAAPGHGPLGGSRPIAESKIERNGLPAGIAAPDFRLPLLYGGELALSEYRGRPVLLVFSDPNCGPCDQLAPRLEEKYRASGEVQVLMVSRGEAAANRTKAAEHGLTFPVVLQRQWEVSREYGMFTTPVAYRIDAAGVIEPEVAVGVERILALPARAPVRGESPAREQGCGCGKSSGPCRCGRKATAAAPVTAGGNGAYRRGDRNEPKF